MPAFLNIGLGFDSTKMRAGMASASEGASQMTRNIGKVETALARIGPLAIAAGGAFAVQFARQSVAASVEQSQALAQLQQAIESTGKVAGFNAGQLERMAQGLQAVTLYGDETVERMQSVLLTFTKIRGEAFERTTEAVLDLSERMKMDLTSSAVQLGKALNDPVANLGALGRAGIQFSQEQREVIKELATTNRLAEAQAIILDELETQFGGSARAAAAAAGGGMKQFSNAASDMQEIVGSLLVPALDKLGKSFVKLKGAIEGPGLPAFLESSALAATAFGAALEFVNRQFGGLPMWLAGNALAAKEAAGATGDLADTTEEFGKALDKAFGSRIRSELEADLRGLEKAIGSAEDRTEAYRDQLRDSLQDIRNWKEGIEQAAEALDDMAASLDQVIDAGEFIPTASFDGLIGTTFEKMGQELEDLTQTFGEQLSDAVGSIGWEQALSQAASVLADQFIDGDVDFSEAFADIGRNLGGQAGYAMGSVLGGPLGGAIGQMIGEVIGQAAGEVIGGLLDSLFGNDKDPVTGTLGFGAGGASSSGILAEFEAWMNTLVQQVEQIIGGVLEFTQDIAVTITQSGEILLTITDQFGNVTEMAFDDMVEAAEYALQQLLQTAQITGEVALAFQEIIAGAQSIEQMFEQLRFVNTLFSEIQAMSGPVGAAAHSIIQQIRAFNELRAEIERLGLSAEAAAPLLAELERGFRRWQHSMQTDVLGRLADLAESLGLEFAFIRDVRIAEVKIEFAIIKAQLKLLELWDRFSDEFRLIRRAALDAARGLEQSADSVVRVAAASSQAADRIESSVGAIHSVIPELPTQDQIASSPEGSIIDFFKGITGPSNPLDSLTAKFREFRAMLEKLAFGDPAREARAFALLTEQFQAAFKRLVDGMKDGIRSFREGLGMGEFSGLFAPERASALASNFQSVLAAALGGDFGAIQGLQSAAQSALQFAASTYGTASSQFKAIRDAIFGGLDEFLAADIQGPAELQLSATTAQTQAIVSQSDLSRRQSAAQHREIMGAFTNLMRAWQRAPQGAR